MDSTARHSSIRQSLKPASDESVVRPRVHTHCCTALVDRLSERRRSSTSAALLYLRDAVCSTKSTARITDLACSPLRHRSSALLLAGSPPARYRNRSASLSAGGNRTRARRSDRGASKISIRAVLEQKVPSPRPKPCLLSYRVA
jgi:hypothetical protein